MKSFTIMVIITLTSDKHLGWLIEAIRVEGTKMTGKEREVSSAIIPTIHRTSFCGLRIGHFLPSVLITLRLENPTALTIQLTVSWGVMVYRLVDGS